MPRESWRSVRGWDRGIILGMLTPRKKALILGVIVVVTLTSLAVFQQQLALTFRRTVLPTLRNLTQSLTALPSGRSNHTDPLANLSDGAGGPPTSSTSRTRKKIVYSCSGGCGGWADRQKGIVSAYVLAAMLDRDFGVHLTFPCDLQRLLGVGRMNWTVRPQDLQGPKAKQYKQLDSAAVTFTKKFLQEKDLDQHFAHDVSVFTWNMEVVQYLQQHPLASRVQWLAGRSVPEVYKQALQDLFSLKPELQKQVDVLQGARPPGTKLVCAQVRLGKHNGSFPDVESWHTFEQFPILVDFLAKYNDSSKFRVFFASDSVEILQRARVQFPEVFLHIPGPITHTDKSRGSDACDGFKKAIEDEYALALCDVLVISESGIGKVASFVRDTDRDLYLFHDVKIEPFTRRGTFPNKSGW